MTALTRLSYAGSSDDHLPLLSLPVHLLQEVSRKLQRAANKTKTWKDKVAKHEGLVRLIQPGRARFLKLLLNQLTFMRNYAG